MHHGIMPSLGNVSVRIRNMDIVIKNIKALYEVRNTVHSIYIGHIVFSATLGTEVYYLTQKVTSIN